METIPAGVLEEHMFFTVQNVMTLKEYFKVVTKRVNFNYLFEHGLVTKKELNAHANFELYLLIKCENRIQNKINREEVVLDKIDIDVLKILCKRIINMFSRACYLFSIEKSYLLDLIDFCQDHVSYLSDVEQLDGLVIAVTRTKDLKCWTKLLQLFMSLELSSMGHLFGVFWLGINILKEYSLPLWELMLSHLDNIQRDLMINTVCTKISMKWQYDYLKWFVLIENISHWCEIFNKSDNMEPSSEKMDYFKIIFDTLQQNSNIEILKKKLKDITEKFGSINIEFWINLIYSKSFNDEEVLIQMIFGFALHNLLSKCLCDMKYALSILKIVYSCHYDNSDSIKTKD